MLPNYVSKNLTAAASTGLGTFSSAGVITLLTSVDLGTGRRIIVWGTSALGSNMTLFGLNETLNPISEAIVTSTAVGGTVATVQDFRKLTSVTLSSGVTSTAAYFGTNTQGGTPWQATDVYRTPNVNLGFNIDITSPTTVSVVSFEYSMDYPSYDVQGRVWQGQNPTVGPKPTISSLGSSVTADTVGYINFPISCWRLTLTSSSSGAGSVTATVVQSG